MRVLPLRQRALAGALALAALLAPGIAAATKPSWGALADIHFQVVNAASGLTNTVIDGIAQDPRGFIWFDAGDQLTRWDGYRAQIEANDPDDVHSSPAGIFGSSGPTVDAQGGVWVGAAGGTVARRAPETGRFDRWVMPARLGENVTVRAIAQEGRDRYLVATSQGVLQLDDAVPGHPGRWSVVGGLSPQIVNSLVVDSAGRAWAGAHVGLFLKRAGAGSFERVPLPGPDRPHYVIGPVDDELWVASDADVNVVDLRTLIVREIPALRASSTSLHHNFTGVVRVDASHVWLGSDAGIVVLDDASGRVSFIRHEPQRADSLPGDDVRGLFRDRSGLVWVATSDGMAVCDPTDRGVTTMSRLGNAGALLSLLDGRILVAPAADASQLLELSPGQEAPRAFVRDGERLRDAGEVSRLARLDDGGVLVGAEHALLHLDTEGRLISRDGRMGSVSALQVDGKRIWIGTGSNGLWTADVQHPDSAARLDRPARTLEIDVIGPRIGGQRLVASSSALRLVDEATGAVSIPQPESSADELPQTPVGAISLDRRGRIWIATEGAGLYVLAPGSVPGRFRSRHLTSRTGLPSDNIDDVEFDDDGTAWLSTDGGGLIAIDPGTFTMRLLDRRDGATFTDYWTGSGGRMPDGSLLFGSHLGVTAVKPHAITTWTDAPATVVTTAQVGDGARVDAVPPAGLVVPADAHKLAVEFATLDYSAPSYNRYRYRLDGVDEHWIDTDATRRQAAYTNLSPGHYTLHMQGSNRVGAWGEELAIPVNVLPAWYQTWWLRTLAALAAAGLAALAHAALTARLLRQRARLEAAVADRTTALRDANLQLEQVNRQLEQASTTDALTGLHNRRYLTQCIAADVAAVHRRREEGEMDAGICFFMVDLDHFKSVNDTYGHAAGDAVLREVARRLEAVARQSDRLIRWGGEEFLLVARDTSLSEAEALADRLCEAMRAAPFELLPGVRVARTCSVGFAALPLFGARPQAADWSDVVDMADRALYLAKAGGRDGWVGLAAGPALAPEVAAVRAAAEDVELAQADGRLVGRSGFGPGGPRLDPAGRAADASLQLAKHFSPETVPFTIGMNNF